MKIKSGKIWPIFLIGLTVMFLCASFGMSYVAKIALEGFAEDSSAYNEHFVQNSKVIQENICSRQRYALIYSNIIANYSDLSREDILDKMERLNANSQFSSMGFVDENGNGFDCNGQDFKIDIIREKRIYTDLNKGVMYYLAPVIKDGENKGYFIGIDSLYIIEHNGYDIGGVIDDSKSSTDIIIIDDDYKLIMETKSAEQYTDYSKIVSRAQNSIIDSDIALFKKQLIMSGVKLSPDSSFTVNDFIYLQHNQDELWFKTEIHTIDGHELTVLAARNASLSTRFSKIILQTALIIGIFVTILLIVWILLITLQTISARRLTKIDYLDETTGCYNMTKFKVDCSKIMKNYDKYQRKHNNTKCAMILFDIDRFKIINDIYGFEKGNQLLKSIAMYMKRNVRKGELATRYTADQFLMFLRCQNEEQILARIQDFDKCLVSIMDVYNLKLTYGIYMVNDNDSSIDQMAVYCAIAKGVAKRNVNSNICIFDDNIRNDMLKDKRIEDAASTAFVNREFEVYLQPKYVVDGSRIAGAEALVRWNSPKLGFVSPGEFIPLFEKNQLVVKLDNYMLEEVCKIQKQWLMENKNIVTISVNISRVHLNEPQLVDTIVNIVDRYELPHKYIELELTESAFFEDRTILVDTVNGLRKLGFSVSMDDFGAGYSSLNSLKDLPMDVIKLDGEFFNHTDDLERSRTVIRDTVVMAKHLNMSIVAEGIELKKQVDFLADIGCDLIQGYYFAKPMPVKEFANQYMQ